MPKLVKQHNFLYLSLVFSLLVLAGLWVLYSATTNWIVNVAGFAMLVIPILALFRAVKSHFAGPIVIGFWGLQLVWISLASWYQISTNQFPWADGNVESLVLPAQALALTAYVSFWVGYERRILMAEKNTDVRGVGNHVQSSVYPLIGATALLPVVLAGSGGLSNRFVNRDTVSSQIASSSLGTDAIYVFFVDRLPAAFVIVSLFLVAREFRFRATEKRFSAWRAIWAFALAAVVVNPFSSPRFISLSAAVAVIVGVVDFGRRKWRVIFSLASVLGMAIVYPLSAWFKKESFQATGVQVELNAFAGIDFDGFQMAMNAIAHTSDQGIQWGKHILSSFFFFVPRSIWPDKAEVSTYEIAYSRGYSWGNLSMPIWAELYLDLGIIGCVVGVFLLGRYSAALDSSIALNGRYAALGGVVAAVIWGFLRGPLGGSMVFFGTAIGIVSLMQVKKVRSVQKSFSGKRKK